MILSSDICSSESISELEIGLIGSKIKLHGWKWTIKLCSWCLKKFIFYWILEFVSSFLLESESLASFNNQNYIQNRAHRDVRDTFFTIQPHLFSLGMNRQDDLTYLISDDDDLCHQQTLILRLKRDHSSSKAGTPERSFYAWKTLKLAFWSFIHAIDPAYCLK